jgi:LAO/AO transport system kinase
MTIVEDSPEAAADLIQTLFRHTGTAYLVGVTGAPGAGKSTLVDKLIAELRKDERTVGVIAVDPTSPFSGGAVLGDRVRMQSHALDNGVFIRSMATRGHLGGLARATADAAVVLDAAGREVVIIETVGVGQDEVDIVRTSDISIVVVVPGMGDEIQALKAGIMEIADIFVVNKSDRDGADRMVAALETVLALHPYGPGDWRPPIVRTTAITGEGIAELAGTIERFRKHSAPTLAARRKARIAARLRDILGQRLLAAVERTVPAGELDAVVARIANREIDPYSAASEILRQQEQARMRS